jgi:hypothetical protein
MASSALSVEIAENHLTPCFYLAVHCREHGEIRIGLAHEPAGQRYACPICLARCDYTLLGAGGTLRALPFWDRPQEVYSFLSANQRLYCTEKS